MCPGLEEGQLFTKFLSGVTEQFNTVGMAVQFCEYAESYWVTDSKWLNFDLCELYLDKGAKTSCSNTKSKTIQQLTG